MCAPMKGGGDSGRGDKGNRQTVALKEIKKNGRHEKLW